MALIKCPECGKEFSSQADACPNCGMPTSVALNSNDVSHNEPNSTYLPPNVPAKTNKNTLKIAMVCGIAFVLLIVVAGFIAMNAINTAKQKKALEEEQALQEMQAKYDSAVRYMSHDDYETAISTFEELGDYNDSKSLVIYCNSLQYCAQGYYDSAYDELCKIPDYENTPALLKQIYYETRFFEGLNDLKATYFNPESIGVSKLNVYYTEGGDNGIEQPVFVALTTGQNRLGGYTADYILFGQSDAGGQYKAQGSTPTLDEDSLLNSSSKDSLTNYLVAKIINELQKRTKTKEIKDAVDINRISNIIKTGNYGKIKRIDELKYKDFGLSMSDDL